MQNKTQHLRAALLKKGFTVRSFATAHDFRVDTVHAAMRGRRKGKLSLSILSKIKEVSHA